MEKFKIAGKRVTAVLTGTLLGTSGVFAGLGTYPNNFIEDDKFNGKFVVGADAAAIDTTSAQSIIDNLKETLRDEAQIEIEYKRENGEDETLSVAHRNSELNYGDFVNDVTRSGGFDDRDSERLGDGTFDNGISKEDYQQNLKLENGEFNYALRDRVDGVERISNNIYYERGDEFASYTLEFDRAIDLSDTDDLKSDFIGESLEIMGENFLISDISASGSDIDSLTLLRDSNKISLSENDSTKITIDGIEYEIEVTTTRTDSARVIINGDSRNINEYSSAKVGGINVVLTDVVDTVAGSPGYAEILVGGVEVELEGDGREVQINGDDISDIYEGYEVESYFDNNNGWKGMTIKYIVDERTSLEEGDSLVDPLFNAFSLEFEGINDVEFNEIEISSRNEEIRIEGVLESGQELDKRMFYMSGLGDGTHDFYIKGDRDGDRIFTKDSVWGDTIDDVAEGIYFGLKISQMPSDGDEFTIYDESGSHNYTFNVTNDEVTSINVTASNNQNTTYDDSNYFNATNTEELAQALSYVLSQDDGTQSIDSYVEEDTILFREGLKGIDYSGSGNVFEKRVVFDLTERDIEGSGFLITDDNDYQYVYIIDSVDTRGDNHEVDFEELIEDRTYQGVRIDEWGDRLATDISGITKLNESYVSIPQNNLGDLIAFENELLMDLSNVEAIGEDLSSVSGGDGKTDLIFSLDTSDVRASEDDMERDEIRIYFQANDDDEEVEIKLDRNYVGAGTGFQNIGNADNTADSSDDKTYVTKYGIMVEYDSKDYESINIMVPDEEVFAIYNIVFGEKVESERVTVSESDLENKKEELRDDGYTIIDTVVVSEGGEIEFDVSSPILDNEVDEIKNMIVVGGPAVNEVARTLLNIEEYDYTRDAGVEEGEAIIRYFSDKNTILVYGYSGEDTAAAVERLKDGGLTGDEINVRN